MNLLDILHKLTDSVSLTQAERDDIHAAIDVLFKDIRARIQAEVAEHKAGSPEAA